MRHSIFSTFEIVGIYPISEKLYTLLDNNLMVLDSSITLLLLNRIDVSLLKLYK